MVRVESACGPETKKTLVSWARVKLFPDFLDERSLSDSGTLFAVTSEQGIRQLLLKSSVFPVLPSQLNLTPRSPPLLTECYLFLINSAAEASRAGPWHICLDLTKKLEREEESETQTRESERGSEGGREGGLERWVQLVKGLSPFENCL